MIYELHFVVKFRKDRTHFLAQISGRRSICMEYLILFSHEVALPLVCMNINSRTVIIIRQAVIQCDVCHAFGFIYFCKNF